MDSKFKNFEKYFMGILTIMAGIGIIFIVILGPLGINTIVYKTHPLVISQIEGQDLASILLIVPLCFISGIMRITNKKQAKYFTIMIPIYVIYGSLSYGIGMEWSNDSISGNSENVFYSFSGYSLLYKHVYSIRL